jgi:uncharacterized delta-60 repeat protein
MTQLLSIQLLSIIYSPELSIVFPPASHQFYSITFFMKKNLFSARELLVVAFLFIRIYVEAQDGALDNTFGVNGKASFVVAGLQDASNAFALQPDGKMITAGTYINGATWDFVVVRLNMNGTPDNTFGIGGKVTTGITVGHDVPWRIVIQPDGKIIVAGYGDNGVNNDVIMVRYNTNGSLDNTFDGDGIVITDLGASEGAFGLAIQPDGKIVAAGVSNAPGQQEAAVFRYNANGTPDNTFDGDGVMIFPGPSTNDHIREVAIQTDGKIIMAGADNYSGGNFRGELVRLNTNGSPDNGFGTNGLVTFPLPYAIFYGMTLQSDGKIVAAGAGATSMNPGSGGSLLARFNSDGTPDNTFNGNGYNLQQLGFSSNFTGVKQQSNGKLIGVGSARFTDPLTGATTWDFLLRRYTTNGLFDNAFDGDGAAIVQFGFNVDDGAALCDIQANGKIVASGFSFNGGSQDFAIIRVNSDLFALPVSLTSFTASMQSGSVLMKWQTATEVNNRGFEIQRSPDGRSYSSIGWVAGTGNSNTLVNYSFIDATPLKGKNFYRLSQVDMDGHSKLSEVRIVDLEKTTGFTIYPNPVTDLLMLQFTNEKTKQVKITALSGKTVWTHTTKSLLLQVPLQALSKGVYIVSVTNKDGEKIIQRFVKD